MFSSCKAIRLLICVLSFSTLALSEEARKLDNYLITFDRIASPTAGIVNAIIRDDRGFLWFGTTRGLCKYDGYGVRVVPNGPDINSGRQVVTSITRFDQESLLLGTLQGLWIFNTRTEQFIPFTSAGKYDFLEESISALGSDRNTIWIGTSTHGLFEYERERHSIRAYSTQQGLRDLHITSILVGDSSRLWVGTFKGGLYMLGPSRGIFDVYAREDPASTALWSDHITTLSGGDDNELWVGTSDGLTILNTRLKIMRKLNLPSPGAHSIWTMAYVPSDKGPGTMWLAASELGLLSHSGGKFTEFTSPDDADRSLRSITFIYRDQVASDNTHTLLWTGTREGVDKILLSNNPFTHHIRGKDGLQLNRGATISLYQDREDVLWVGLWGGGLNGLRRENGSYRRVMSFETATSHAIPSDDVICTYEDRTGNLWIGTSRGISVLSRERKHAATYVHDESDSTSLPGNEVTQFYEDRSGRFWICTDGGLACFIPGTPPHFQNFLHQAYESHPAGRNVVTSILEDPASQLWVTTFGRGLIKIANDGTMTRFTQKNDSTGYYENHISTAVEDGKGMFWLSTGAGLASFDPRTGKFQSFPISQLNDAVIMGILPDDRGYVWLSTKIGLLRYNPATLSAVLLDEKYGMPFRELFSDFHRNKGGRVFVGGMDGFSEFSTDSAFSTSPPPEIAITGFSVFDKDMTASLAASNSIRLSHDQNFFSFTFAALDYVYPQKNRFAFRMVGVDDHWTDAGTRNYASYTNLDPGEYTFEVKGSNSQHVWNEAGTAVAISILPPYWKTWWFQLVFGMIVLAIGYATYRYRVRRLLEVERLRLRIADDLHDDVGSNLSTIAIASRSVQRAPDLSDATRKKLADIYDTALVTSEGMKDIVWFIKPENDTLDSLILRMKDIGSSLLGDIEHDFRWSGNGSSVQVTIDFKRNFFLAYKEILNNIVKHSSTQKVEIQVEQRDGVLEMVIRDFGKGFTESGSRGNGLRSMKSRAARIGGECEVTSSIGEGTTVRFSGKL